MHMFIVDELVKGPSKILIDRRSDTTRKNNVFVPKL